MSPEGRESDGAEARAAAGAERRAAQEERLRKQLERMDEHLAEERAAFEKEVARRTRDESRSAPPGWTGEIVVGPGTPPEVRDAIGGS